ncbi:MAG: NusG domain II-containing protein [Clostridia bacterium]|nr:NusG domain II-containing protein [Clostridia bacterium]
MDQTNEKPTPQNKKRKLKNDLVLIGTLLAVLVLIGLALWLLRGEGDIVVVEVNGTAYGSYALNIDRTVEIRTGEGGKELNLLVIKDGKAYVETATCPDGICAAHRPIFRRGESIICLPHKVVITVVKAELSDDAPDVVG